MLCPDQVTHKTQYSASYLISFMLLTIHYLAVGHVLSVSVFPSYTRYIFLQEKNVIDKS